MLTPHPRVHLALIGLIFALVALAPFPVTAQDNPKPNRKLRVLHSDTPIYPQIARTARVQGQVTILVTVVDGLVTDTQITGVRIPLLERSTTDNIKSWRFNASVNTTFTTTFRYVINGKSFHNRIKIKKRLPYFVQIQSDPVPVETSS